MSVYIPDELASAEGGDVIPQVSMLDNEPHGNMVERWSSRLTLRFVLLYGAYPCLWNPAHTDYKNKLARDKAVHGIISGMGLQGFDVKGCRRKIRIIRSTYWNECAKINRSAKYGTPYKPKLSWFAQAHQFLSKIPGWKELQGWNGAHVDAEPEVEDLMGPEDHPKRIKTEPDGPSHHHSAFDDLSREDHDPASALFFAERDGPMGPNCVQEENEFDIFGKSVACQLRQLPLVEALEVQMEIQTLISQRRLRCLRQEQNGPPTGPPSVPPPGPPAGPPPGPPSGPPTSFMRQEQNCPPAYMRQEQNGPSYVSACSTTSRVNQGRMSQGGMMDNDVGPLV